MCVDRKKEDTADMSSHPNNIEEGERHRYTKYSN
jgi:hypothetical protein